MTETQVRLSKWALNLLWIFAAASFLFPAGGARSFGQLVFWVMLVAHAIELPFYWRTLKATGKPMAGHIAQVILYGIVYYMSIKKEPAAG